MYLVHDRDDHVHDAGRDAALALSFLREHDECVEKMRGRIESERSSVYHRVHLRVYICREVARRARVYNKCVRM